MTCGCNVVVVRSSPFIPPIFEESNKKKTRASLAHHKNKLPTHPIIRKLIIVNSYIFLNWYIVAPEYLCTRVYFSLLYDPIADKFPKILI